MSFAAAFLATATATLAAAPTVEQLLARYDEVMGSTSYQGVFAMTARREDGSERTYVMRILKDGNDKMRVWFDEPAAVKGQEMLRQGENLWVYMPSLKRAVRMASRDSFQGGDFNNADVLRVNYQADYAGSLVEAESAGDAWVLDLRAKTSDAAYERIKLWMEKKRGMPLRAEYYSNSGKMLRSAEFLDVRSFDGFVRPSRVQMRNRLAEKRSSEMLIRSFDAKAKPAATTFVLDNLGR